MLKNKFRKDNNKGFTLIEIVLAVAAMLGAAVTIGVIMVGTQNSSQKLINEAGLQQQLTDTRDYVQNQLLEANAGIKYWTKDSAGSAWTSVERDNGEEAYKMLAIYNVDPNGDILQKQYLKFDGVHHVLYSGIITDTLDVASAVDGKIDVDEDIAAIDSALANKWTIAAEDISVFNFDATQYKSKKLVKFDIETSDDDVNYESGDTVYIRNAISFNTALDVSDIEDTKFVLKLLRPALSSADFTYDGELHSPKEKNFDSKYIQRINDSVTEAKNANTYTITYHLIDPTTTTWSDGTTSDVICYWLIRQRPAVIEWDQLKFPYTGSHCTPTCNVISGVVPGDTVTAIITPETIGPAIGSWPVTATLSNPNYEIENSDAAKQIAEIGTSLAAYSKNPESVETPYTGSDVALVIPGETSHGTIMYKVGDGDFSADLPTAVDAGVYKISYYIKADTNHTNSEIRSLNSTITKATGSVTVNATAKNLTYTGAVQTLVEAAQGTGKIMYSLDNNTFSEAIPSGKDAGPYTVYYYASESQNYTKSSTKSISVTIKTKAMRVEKTNGSDIYRGSSTDGGAKVDVVEPNVGYVIKYGITDGSYDLTEIPKYKDSGTHTVYFEVTAPNYTTYHDSLQITIGKNQGVVVKDPVAKSLTYNGSAQELILPGIANTNLMKYSIDGVNFSNIIPTGINAGTYTVTYFAEGTSLYEPSEKKTLTVVIKPKNMTVSTIDGVGNYSGDLISGGARVIVSDPSADYVIKYGTTEGVYNLTEIPGFKAPGTHTVFYQVTNSNYVTKTGSLNIRILKTIGSVTPPTAKNLTYNGSSQVLINAGSSTTGTIEYRIGSGTWSTELPKGTNAGKYVVWYRVIGDENHEDVSPASIECFIKTNEIQVTATNGVATYTGSLTNGGARVNVTKPTSGYVIRYGTTFGDYDLVDMPTYKDVNVYTVYYQVTAENYNSKSGSFTITINKQAANAEAPKPITSLVYNGTSPSNGTAQALITAGSANGIGTMQYRVNNGTWSTDIPTGINAGEYTIGWRIIGDANHNDVSEKTFKVTIDKKLMNVSTRNGVAEYNGTAQIGDAKVVVNSPIGYNIKYGTVEGTYNDDAPLGVTNVGTETRYFEITAPNFYTFRGQFTITITKKQAQVTAPTAKTGLVYNGTTTTNGSAQKLINEGSTSTGTLQYRVNNGTWGTTAPTGKDAGTYLIEYRVIGGQNYTDINARSFTVTIAPKSMNYSVKNGTSVYNESATSGGAAVTVSTPTDTANVTIRYGTTKGTYDLLSMPTFTDKGIYNVYFEITANNFTTVYGQLTINITEAEIKVSTTNGSATYNGNAQTGGASLTVTSPAGTTVKYGTSASSCNSSTIPGFTDVGTHTVYYSVSKTKYTTKTGYFQITINKAPTSLSVTNPQTWTIDYSSSAQTKALTAATQPNALKNPNGITYAIIDQKQGGANVNYFTLSGTTLTAAKGTPSGSYKVRISAYIAGTANFEPVSAEFVVDVTVKGSTITVTNNGNQSYTYNRTAQGHGISARAGNGAEVTILYSENRMNINSLTPITKTNVNTNNITTVYYTVSAPNCVPVSGSYTLTINPKEVGLSWGTCTWTYDGRAHSTTCTATGVVSGDTCSVDLSGNYIGANVGSTTVTASSLSNSNYKLPSSKTATLIINQKEVGLSWGTCTWTYDGSAHSTTCTATNLVSGDTCYVNLSGNYIGSNVGSTTVTASSLSNGNYKLPSSKTATLTINRARTATASGSTLYCNGGNQTGVSGSYVSWAGTITAKAQGSYTAYATPDGNHAWSDGTTSQRTITWTINHTGDNTGSTITAATCTTNGSRYKKCTGCGANYDSVTIGALGHTGNSAWYHEGGYCYKTCSRCGSAHYDAAAYSSKSHSDNTAATCTNTGWKDKTYCSHCGTILNWGSSIAALGHNWGGWSSINGSQHRRTCRNDGSHTETENHNSNSYGGTAGVHLKCSLCAQTMSSSHNTNGGSSVKIAATCTTYGTHTYTCSCGYSWDSQDIATIAHSGNSAWYHYSGYCYKTCSSCSAHYDAAAYSSKSHSDNTAATCTNTGWKDKTYCSRCATILTSGSSIPALDHTGDDTGSTITAATCETNGSRYKKCTRCGANYSSVTIGALGHTGDNVGSTISYATCETNGSRYKKCTRCGDNYDSVTLYAFGHNWYTDATYYGECRGSYTVYRCANNYSHTTGSSDTRTGHESNGRGCTIDVGTWIRLCRDNENIGAFGDESTDIYREDTVQHALNCGSDVEHRRNGAIDGSSDPYNVRGGHSYFGSEGANNVWGKVTNIYNSSGTPVPSGYIGNAGYVVKVEHWSNSYGGGENTVRYSRNAPFANCKYISHTSTNFKSV